MNHPYFEAFETWEAVLVFIQKGERMVDRNQLCRDCGKVKNRRPDCGARDERAGHMTCQYPQDRV